VVELTNAFDPSPTDTGAGFRYAYAVDDAMALDGLTYADLASSSSSAAFDLDAGAYTIYGRIFDKDDGFTQYETQVVVTPAVLTIAADHQTKVYGDADPALTFVASGFQFGDTEATVLTGNLARAPGEDVGGYAIDQGTLTATSNYLVGFSGHDLVITPAPLTVTADDAQREYGDANPPFPGTIVGIKNNDAISASYSTSATATSSVGDYPIVPALNDPDNRLGNYDVTINHGTLTVTPATLTVDVDDATWEIGTPFPTFTGTISGAKNGESFNVVYSSVADATSTAGQYPITAAVNGSTLSNYDVVVNDGTLTITAAEVRVDISPESFNIDRNGAVTFVIFGSAQVDASLVDVNSLTFAGVEIDPFNQRLIDVDRDGRLDLRIHFQMTDEVQHALEDIYAGLLLADYADDGRYSSRQSALLAVDGYFGQYGQEFSGAGDVDLFMSGRSLRDLLASLGLD
jgi:hypothetical protein